MLKFSPWTGSYRSASGARWAGDWSSSVSCASGSCQRVGGPRNGKTDTLPGSPSGGYEEGVSCFPASCTSGGHILLDLSDRLQKQFVMLVGLSGRTAYLIGGEVVGVGGDEEPVLRNAYFHEALNPLRLVATKMPSWTVEALNAARMPASMATAARGHFRAVFG